MLQSSILPAKDQSSPSDQKWRILLADDHGIVRDAVSQMLERLDPTLQVDSARDFGEAVAKLRGGAPISLLLLDFRMPGMNGAASIADIKSQFPKLPVGIISGLLSPDEVEPLIQAGAVGVFPKTMSGPALLMALKLAMSGQVYVPWRGDLHQAQVPGMGEFPQPAAFPPATAHSAPGGMPGAPPPDLTDRQREVLRMVVAGAPNKTIALHLKLSEVTVKIHVAALCRKFSVANRTQLATAAIRAGLGSPV